jgi:hypothetical protein
MNLLLCVLPFFSGVGCLERVRHFRECAALWEATADWSEIGISVAGGMTALCVLARIWHTRDNHQSPCPVREPFIRLRAARRRVAGSGGGCWGGGGGGGAGVYLYG